MLLVTFCYRNWEKLWPDRSLGSYADFFVTLHHWSTEWVVFHGIHVYPTSQKIECFLVYRARKIKHKVNYLLLTLVMFTWIIIIFSCQFEACMHYTRVAHW